LAKQKDSGREQSEHSNDFFHDVSIVPSKDCPEQAGFVQGALNSGVRIPA
jgi:hypothetical protein